MILVSGFRRVGAQIAKQNIKNVRNVRQNIIMMGLLPRCRMNHSSSPGVHIGTTSEIGQAQIETRTKTTQQVAASMFDKATSLDDFNYDSLQAVLSSVEKHKEKNSWKYLPVTSQSMEKVIDVIPPDEFTTIFKRLLDIGVQFNYRLRNLENHMDRIFEEGNSEEVVFISTGHYSNKYLFTRVSPIEKEIILNQYSDNMVRRIIKFFNTESKRGTTDQRRKKSYEYLELLKEKTELQVNDEIDPDQKIYRKITLERQFLKNHIRYGTLFNKDMKKLDNGGNPIELQQAVDLLELELSRYQQVFYSISDLYKIHYMFLRMLIITYDASLELAISYVVTFFPKMSYTLESLELFSLIPQERKLALYRTVSDTKIKQDSLIVQDEENPSILSLIYRIICDSQLDPQSVARLHIIFNNESENNSELIPPYIHAKVTKVFDKYFKAQYSSKTAVKKPTIDLPLVDNKKATLVDSPASNETKTVNSQNIASASESKSLPHIRTPMESFSQSVSPTPQTIEMQVKNRVSTFLDFQSSILLNEPFVMTRQFERNCLENYDYLDNEQKHLILTADLMLASDPNWLTKPFNADQKALMLSLYPIELVEWILSYLFTLRVDKNHLTSKRSKIDEYYNILEMKFDSLSKELDELDLAKLKIRYDRLRLEVKLRKWQAFDMNSFNRLKNLNTDSVVPLVIDEFVVQTDKLFFELPMNDPFRVDDMIVRLVHDNYVSCCLQRLRGNIEWLFYYYGIFYPRSVRVFNQLGLSELFKVDYLKYKDIKVSRDLVVERVSFPKTFPSRLVYRKAMNIDMTSKTLINLLQKLIDNHSMFQTSNEQTKTSLINLFITKALNMGVETTEKVHDVLSKHQDSLGRFKSIEDEIILIQIVKQTTKFDELISEIKGKLNGKNVNISYEMTKYIVDNYDFSDKDALSKLEEAGVSLNLEDSEIWMKKFGHSDKSVLLKQMLKSIKV
ncbi:hypothetical protein CANARDRAFT_29057 [[Candida] arabinofermentans NRRL YB-2248]|uniref:Uncharacterized protein n=1 Tax=[Candida] arabinofermentans NRRL YB-2248 TaxID=983967 RepID=A0A1E4SYF5_9ASCO|nr:hypothetical protein CANARDRAFT_29057 [[Candida] arabinofermentans NRRL YB-2248]